MSIMHNIDHEHYNKSALIRAHVSTRVVVKVVVKVTINRTMLL
jgi:hypothetical protein